MQRNLTDRFIRSLKPAPGKRVTVFDTRVTGLCVRVTNAGHVSFYVMSRDPGGKQRWAEIRDGHAPVTSLAKARELAPGGVANIKNGNTAFPKPEPKPEIDTYSAVVDRFVRQYAKPRQRTWKETERILNSLPWGKRPITGITKRDAIEHLGNLVEADKRPTARVTLSWIKTLWRWAWRQEIVPFPIMDALSADDFGIVKTTRDRVYTDAEIKALWNATGDLGTKERGFVKLVTLLGVRAKALSGMRRDELDDPEHPTLWTIPTERVKTRKSQEHKGRVYVVPISPLARRVLIPLVKGGDLVFESTTRKGIPMDAGTGLRNKVREASGIDDWGPHAHRHTIATWLQDRGHDEYDRGLVLQHAGAGTVTSGYSHGYSLGRARELLEAWEAHVQEIVAPEGTELLA